MLEIHCILGMRWVALVANTQIYYPFAGLTLEQQTVNVRAFAQTLADGQDDIYQFFGAPDLPPGELEQQLFGDTTSLMFDGYVEYFEDELMYNTVKVGEIILDLLLG